MLQHTKRFIAFALSLSLINATPPVSAQSEVAACDPSVACFDVKIGPDHFIGNFLLDGAPVAVDANAARLTATPGTAHTIEVKNIREPAGAGFGDLYVYADQTLSGQAGRAGQVKALKVAPAKTFIKGALMYTCELRSARTGDDVACLASFDGAPQPAIAPNATATINLLAGPHVVHTELVGAQAGNWSTTARDDNVTINGGRATLQTTRLRASFVLKGLLKISLPQGVVGDLFVNDTPIAQQAPSAEVHVAPGVAQTIVARNISDPAAQGRYQLADVTQTATAGAGGTRAVKLSPRRVWLVGSVSVACRLEGKRSGEDAFCSVNGAGKELGRVEAAQKAAFELPIGPQDIQVTVSGTSAIRWGGPITGQVTIVGNATTNFPARFALLPATLPETLPADIPVFPGAEFVSTIEGAEAQGGVGFGYRTSESQQAVVDFYRANLPGQGWLYLGSGVYHARDVIGYAFLKSPYAVGIVFPTEPAGDRTVFAVVIVLAQW